MQRLSLASLTFVSGNEHKLKEYSELLGIPNLRTADPQFEEPQSLNLDILVEAKIRRVQNLVAPPFFVEHTGLFISGWNDFPGGLSSQMMERVRTHGLCRMLNSYSDSERIARAEVAIGYYHPEHQKRIFRGETMGRIAQAPRGEAGFGWDSIFIPDGGNDRTYGQMSVIEKNHTSMRRKAAERFGEFLRHHYVDDTMLQPRGEVFVSYSHDDERWFEQLRIMMAPLIRDKSISLWTDRDISPGEMWRAEIEAALSRTKVGVLLISPNFLNSEFINREELPYLLDAARIKEVKILWVLLSQCLYEKSSISDYQAAHHPLLPLDSLSPSALNEALAQVANNIERAANS